MTVLHRPEPPLPEVEEPTMRRCGHYIELTEGEAVVLAMLAGDLNSVRIADRTGWSYNVARGRLLRLKRKTGAESAPQVVDVACRTGLLVPPLAGLRTPLPPLAVLSFRAVAHGRTNRQVALLRGVSESTVGADLAAIRHRMRTEGNPAAVYRLHGVPGVMDTAVPPCPACSRGAAR
ncbi:hypothetical protein ABTZ03_23280 [Kitasatospora sp. NPDC096077]|uniref:helix-turn-helix transcriptional regulator n=1 Tax=Kitasatospora sp. NPDC096077 TaxID=3155544 RepID=UPI0033177A6A